MSVRREYKNLPKKQSNRMIIQPTQVQQRRAMSQLGFINGGRFIRSPALQSRLRAQRGLSVEVKGVDTDVTSQNPILSTTNTNGDIYPLNLVQQGAGSWNRIGRKINLKSLRLKLDLVFTISPVATTAATVQLATRIVLVWDKQPSGNALPTFDTIFGTTSQLGNETSEYKDPIKYDSMSRFEILMDKVYDSSAYNGIVTTSGTTNVATMIVSVDEYVKLVGRQTVFSGQSNPMTIADVYSGGLYLVYRASNAVAVLSASNTNANSFCRLRYTDV